jgi:hypothetical protein
MFFPVLEPFKVDKLILFISEQEIVARVEIFDFVMPINRLMIEMSMMSIPATILLHLNPPLIVHEPTKYLPLIILVNAFLNGR